MPKVLVIDSNEDSILEAMIGAEEKGMEADFSKDMVSALEKMDKEDFLYVLTDMEIPRYANGPLDEKAGETICRECQKRGITVAVVSEGRVRIPDPAVRQHYSNEAPISFWEIATYYRGKNSDTWKYTISLLNDIGRLPHDFVLTARQHGKTFQII